MTHQHKSEMHPADINAINDRIEWLTSEYSDALTKAILCKAVNHRLDIASPYDLHKYAMALIDLSEKAERMEKAIRERNKAGI